LINIRDIRNASVHEEIDYLFLKSILRNYSRPRAKITNLLKNKDLIRVKKGLYVFGERYAKKPYVIETLANLIYGPSSISLEYALSYYGMIPERVEVVTSVTSKRDKVFHTPIGTFSYRYLHQSKYPIGITEVMIDETHPILIATPEKALADKIMLASPGLQLANKQDVAEYLYEDLRIPEQKIAGLDLERLSRIKSTYQDQNVSLLYLYLMAVKDDE
jgi:hypothetical protein